MATSTMPVSSLGAKDPRLKGPLLLSLVFHVVLFGALITSTIFSHQGDSWGGPGGGGGAIAVTLVGGAPAIPLPQPEVTTENRVVDDTKGLYKAEPLPKEPPPAPDTTELPKFDKEKPLAAPSKPSRLLDDKTPPPPPPENAVPYGQGGAPAVPYSQATQPVAPTPGAAQAQPGQFALANGVNAGLGFTGSGGGGDFGGRFPWYVTAVRNRVSSNWLQSTVDPSVRFAPRAVVTFDILKDGALTNVQVLQSSGNSSVDTSAVRAVVSSNPVGPLPNEYSGNKVSVEFWFDFKR